MTEMSIEEEKVEGMSVLDMFLREKKQALDSAKSRIFERSFYCYSTLIEQPVIES